MPKEPKHTLAARARVLDAHREGGDWMLVAHHNGIPPTTARNIVERGTPELKKRGGARATITKCTPEMESALVYWVQRKYYTFARSSSRDRESRPRSMCFGWENLVRDRCDLVLLRLGPYLQSHRRLLQHLESTPKAYLALSHEEMMNVPYGQKTELRMQLLEKAAEHAMPCMDLRLVNKMAHPCALSVAAAIRGGPWSPGFCCGLNLLWSTSQNLSLF
ncbi:hypothetical protein PR001_g27294 [Phytophthora rubi]|uniref:Uncharacterized protein n=1 Tax=Phytophthora rubi TaxID=129364 RepID=A0A6A3HK87_9STRA|nr:hypothetical protein PR001_g27294 [Phytophthora rubi]